MQPDNSIPAAGGSPPNAEDEKANQAQVQSDKEPFDTGKRVAARVAQGGGRLEDQDRRGEAPQRYAGRLGAGKPGLGTTRRRRPPRRSRPGRRIAFKSALEAWGLVIPAQAGIQSCVGASRLDARFRGHDSERQAAVTDQNPRARDALLSCLFPRAGLCGLFFLGRLRGRAAGDRQQHLALIEVAVRRLLALGGSGRLRSPLPAASLARAWPPPPASAELPSPARCSGAAPP